MRNYASLYTVVQCMTVSNLLTRRNMMWRNYMYMYVLVSRV